MKLSLDVKYKETAAHSETNEIAKVDRMATLYFEVSVRQYENFQNSFDMKKKVVCFKEFLKSAVLPESRDELEMLITERGLAMQIGGDLLEAFTGDVEITVKN